MQEAIASTHADAQVRGHEMVLKSLLSVGAASRSKSKNAFVQETKQLVQNMLKSMVRRLEVQLMYGQSGLGIIESVTGAVLKIEDHEWAGGLWSGMEKAAVEIYDATLATLRGSARVVSVDSASKEITLDAAPAGTVATDVIFFKSAKANEFAGLHKILTNTGTLFNIDASTNNLWKANVVPVGTNFSGGEAVLSFAKIEEAIATAMDKGLAEMDVIVICSPKSWKNLLTEQAAKRMYDSSYSASKVTNGSKDIEFHGQNGKITIKSSIFCKAGYAYVISPDCFERIGSSDITFEQPGMEGKFFRLVEGYNAYELRAYTDQALFCSQIGIQTLLTYIKD